MRHTKSFEPITLSYEVASEPADWPGAPAFSSLAPHRRTTSRILGAVAMLTLISAQADSLDTWSLIQSKTNTVLSCIAYDGNGFIAAGVDNASGLILRSDDGASWSPVASPITNVLWEAVVYAEGTFRTMAASGKPGSIRRAAR